MGCGQLREIDSELQSQEVDVHTTASRTARCCLWPWPGCLPGRLQVLCRPQAGTVSRPPCLRIPPWAWVPCPGGDSFPQEASAGSTAPREEDRHRPYPAGDGVGCSPRTVTTMVSVLALPRNLWGPVPGQQAGRRSQAYSGLQPQPLYLRRREGTDPAMCSSDPGRCRRPDQRAVSNKLALLPDQWVSP